MEKKKQHSWKRVSVRERDMQRETEREVEGGSGRGKIFIYMNYGIVSSSLTSHAIVAEPFTELIPHNEEHREWKGSQFAELLY